MLQNVFKTWPKDLITLIALVAAVSGCGGGGGGSSADDTNTTATTPSTAPASTPETSPTAPTTPTTTPTTIPTTTPPIDPSTTEIKLLVLMSEGLDGLYADPTLRINHLVNFSNRILADSGVNLVLTLAEQQRVNYPIELDVETALNDLTAGSHSAFANVASLRTAARADLVVFMRPYANDGRCGIAWIGGYLTNGDLSDSYEYGFSVVSPNCSDYTLLHEIGHNLGLGHSRAEGASAGSLDYGRGHGESGNFATVMSSPTFYAAPRVPRLASPLTDCMGSPCGVNRNNATQGADAVHALQQTMDQVAAYQP